MDYSWVWHVLPADHYTQEEIEEMYHRIPRHREDLLDDFMDRLYPMPSPNSARKDRLVYSYQSSRLAKPKVYRQDRCHLGIAASLPRE
jgi:hypothetical protein